MGISKPSTMVNHSIKASQYLEEDFSLNKKARIAIKILNDRLPMILNAEKIKEMNFILEQSETLSEKIKGAMDVIGMSSDKYFNQNVYEEYKPKDNELISNNTSLKTKGVEL